MTRLLDGKVVIVTGGSRGIGRAAALKCAGEGARVVIAARGAEQGNRVVGEIAAAGGRACFVATDVSKSEEVERLVTAAVQTFGRVNCALTMRPRSPRRTRPPNSRRKSLIARSRRTSRACGCASEGIRVNALVAGAFATDMLEQVMARASGADPEARTRIEARYASLIPLGRIGRPEEAAEAPAWLCSDAASYLTATR